ncbi:MAG: hypothetical protein Fur0041_10370 [Bacteroidia bacterium]
MRTYAKHIAWIVIVLLFSFDTKACDICGTFMGITPYDNQSNIMLLHRYRLFSQLDGINNPVFPSGAYRLPGNYSPLHSAHETPEYVKGDFESFKTYEVRMKYFIHQRVELTGILPVVMNKYRTGGITEKVNGISDPVLMVGYHVIRRVEDVKFMQRLIIGIGIKFRAGNDAVMNDGSERHTLFMQPGTGTNDVMGYFQYLAGYKKCGLSFTLTGKQNGTNAYGEQIAFSSTVSSGLFYRIKKNKFTFMPQLQFYSEYTKGVYVNHVFQEHSGVNTGMLGAGTDIYLKQFGFHSAVQWALYDKNRTYAPGATMRAVVGLSFNFNQSKYILSSKK